MENSSPNEESTSFHVDFFQELDSFKSK